MDRGSAAQASWTFEADIPPEHRPSILSLSTDIYVLWISVTTPRYKFYWYYSDCPDTECEFKVRALNKEAVARSIRYHIRKVHTPKWRRNG